MEKLTKIEIASSHLLEIINNVLELSKIEAGKFVLQHVPVHIPTLLENITSILGQKAQEKGLDLLMDAAPGTCPVYGDDSRLQQALLRVSAEEAERTIRQKLGSKRILLVEDEPINREIAQALLEDVGFVVDLAEDGGKAIERVQAATYDLILMDMQMPHINGLETTRQIRLLPRRGDHSHYRHDCQRLCRRSRTLHRGWHERLYRQARFSVALYQKLCAWLQRGN